MKRVVKNLVAVLLACLLCGCGSEKVSDEIINADQGEVIVTTADPNDKREVITFGMWSAVPEMMLEVNAFNEINAKYRIEVVTNPSVEYEDYFTNRAMKVMTGRGEDLLFIGNDMRVRDYIENGVLEDLRPYIQRDLNEEDYIGEVLHAYEKDGKIYGIFPSFGISVLLGKKEDVGNKKIQFDDLPCLMKETGATTLMARNAMDTLWYLYCYFGMDLTNRQELKEGILLAETYSDKGGLGGEVGLKLGKDALFLELSMNRLSAIVGTEMSYGALGVDTEVVPGGILYCGAVSINNASEKKEGAWEFISFLLSEERQIKRTSESSDGFPISRVAFEEKIEADFEYVERRYREIDVETPMKKERYLEMIETWLPGSKTLYMGVDYDAWRIVSEEVEAYYSGQKSLDEVLDIIESRMRIYLGEKE